MIKLFKWLKKKLKCLSYGMITKYKVRKNWTVCGDIVILPRLYYYIEKVIYKKFLFFKLPVKSETVLKNNSYILTFDNYEDALEYINNNLMPL